MKIAFLGQPGTFSEQAAYETFKTFEPRSCASFEAVFDAVESGTCDAGIIPIENSLAGKVVQNIELLQKQNVKIVREMTLRVRHCLIALPGAEKAGIRRVISHPQPLKQCAHYLQGLRVQTETAVDTVSAVKMMAERGDSSLASIASRRAAELHGMSILDEGIEDDPDNTTRFYVIVRLDATSPLA